MCKEENNSTSTLKSAFEWISSLIAASIVIAVVFCFVFRVVTVDGESMTNTLRHGDNLIMISRFYSLDRGDVVVINYRDGSPLIKRVIGMPGDVIDIDDKGCVLINGEVLDEPYTRDGVTDTKGAELPYTVGENEIYALGDNRLESMDSRMIGAFSIDDVMGQAVYRVFPLDRMGQFD